MKRDNIVKFRKPAKQKPRKSKLRIPPFVVVVVAVFAIGAVLFALDHQGGRAIVEPTATAQRTVSVAWVDGDSGSIDGREFRLHGVDAPEGSPFLAKCVAERELAEKARQAARKQTAGQTAIVSRSYGKDGYGRELVDLRVAGQDVATALIQTGHLRRWNFESDEPKPSWCR